MPIPWDCQIYGLFTPVLLQVLQESPKYPPVVEDSWGAAPGRGEQLLQLRMEQLVGQQLLPAQEEEEEEGQADTQSGPPEASG